MVGTMSITWWNCVRMPPASLMRFGHEITRPLRVPPKCEATCFVHWNGVSKAWAHAACDQRGTVRRTERGDMKLRVAQPGLGETVHRRRRNRPAERAGGAIPGIVGENEQYVGSARGRMDLLGEIR